MLVLESMPWNDGDLRDVDGATRAYINAKWKAVIAAIRASGYTGKLTTASLLNYPEFDWYGDLDYLGESWWFQPVATSDSDTVQSVYDQTIKLLNSWYLPAVNRFHKPLIFVQVEYYSAHTSALQTYSFGPQISQGNAADPSVPSDYDEQGRMYQAVLLAFAATPWVQGSYSFGYEYYNLDSKGYSIRGKTAEQITSQIYQQINNPGCSYSLNYSGLAFAAQGGTGTITITTGTGCTWSVGALPAGVMLTSAGSGVGTGSITFQVSPNAGGSVSSSFTIADQTFTIEQSATSIAGLTAAGSLGQVASEGTWVFSLIGINLGASSATARFSFADNNGNPLMLPLTFPQLPPAAGPELASTLDRTLSPNAQVVMESTGPDSVPPLVGSGQLQSNGNVSGFGIFSNPKQSWNAVVPLETRNASRYVLAFDNSAPLTTGVAVASLAAQAQNVTAIVKDDKGVQIGSNATISLSAMGHTSFMLNNPPPGFPATAGKRGTIEFDTTPGGQLSVLGLRANGPALTTLPVLANVGTSGGSITHVAYNGGWTSVFYIVNTGNASAQFTLSFFDENGVALPVPLLLPENGTNTTTAALTQTLAAGAMLVVNTQAEDAQSLVIGSAQLTTTGNISGFEIFRWTSFGQEASVPVETRTPGSFVLVFDDTNGLTTGVALANLIATAANVTVRIYDDAGTLLQTTAINLGSRGHTSFMLPANYAATANKRGMVEFVLPPGAKISVIGLRAKNDGTLTTIPVLTK